MLIFLPFLIAALYTWSATVRLWTVRGSEPIKPYNAGPIALEYLAAAAGLASGITLHRPWGWLMIGAIIGDLLLRRALYRGRASRRD